jgi:hypothetical protein
MTSSRNLQGIRISTKFAIAGIMLLICMVAIAIAYYRTIVIDEESQRIDAETRAVSNVASVFDTATQ